MCKLTDNSFLQTKLELRRYFMKKYPSPHAPVLFDAFSGEGAIWSVLAREFPVQWIRNDAKKRGLLRLDVRRHFLQTIHYDVIDLDTYGLPYDEMEAVLLNNTGEYTLFLTAGHVMIGGGTRLSYLEARAVGISAIIDRVPMPIQSMIRPRITEKVIMNILSGSGVQVVEVAEGFPNRNAQYFGIRAIKNP